ncbi:hypothetical protein BT93_L1056 [Corymbia citriodora subsp. variegata]|uniref:Protein phosphatase methylesterase 1 n=1 Tax=Corymbia citriodora subsp. variegata TaxID=360336 RepID=A0A8T0CEB8_CORYI|nr:hypothetical protein BT93_L1056 [Corymbia citriodora subsp. variegata]
MSDLLRALPKIKQNGTAPRPTPFPLTTAHEDGGSSSSDSSVSTTDSIDTLRPVSEYSTSGPNPWSQYFNEELWLESSTETQKAIYHAYLTPPIDPAKGPLFICHHGAGASGMSFARFATAVKGIMPRAGVCSLEAREHGSTVTTLAGEEVLDFSIGSLVADALTMIRLLAEKKGWKTLPPTVLVGHSLGGAVVTRIAAEGSLGPQLIGFAVLDVVEGSAIEALMHMKTYIASRPASFASPEDAIDWHVRSRTIRDRESARASVPNLLVSHGDRWVWRTDLARTQKWWEEWFTGMSAGFLKGRAAKSLVLAGTDRLDRELMVGQMQGRQPEECFWVCCEV